MPSPWPVGKTWLLLVLLTPPCPRLVSPLSPSKPCGPSFPTEAGPIAPAGALARALLLPDLSCLRLSPALPSGSALPQPPTLAAWFPSTESPARAPRATLAAIPPHRGQISLRAAHGGRRWHPPPVPAGSRLRLRSLRAGCCREEGGCALPAQTPVSAVAPPSGTIHPSLKSVAAPQGFPLHSQWDVDPRWSCQWGQMQLGGGVWLCWHHATLSVLLSAAGQTPPGRWALVLVPPLPASLLTPLHVHVLLPRRTLSPEVGKPRGASPRLSYVGPWTEVFHELH